MLTRNVGDVHSSILPPKAKRTKSFFLEGGTRFLQESNALADDCRHLKRVFSMRLV